MWHVSPVNTSTKGRAVLNAASEHLVSATKALRFDPGDCMGDLDIENRSQKASGRGSGFEKAA
eukprot:810308-Alexandrium_andersonii.AAC.1